jgi:hypothetical protein
MACKLPLDRKTLKQLAGRWLKLLGLPLALAAIALVAWSSAGSMTAKVARCDQGCQCHYCDSFENGQCIVNGRPASCGDWNGLGQGQGCVGMCTSFDPPNCLGRDGVGGCGYICDCRNSDCLPDALKTPEVTPPPPPTEPPCVNCRCPQPEVTVKKPKMAGTDYRPPYPVVVRQDPNALGFEISVDAQGGSATRKWWKQVKKCTGVDGNYPGDCPEGPWEYDCEEKQLTYNDPIERIEVTMDLAGSSRGWITGYLNSRYYGASVREPLPHKWEFWTGSSMRVMSTFHYMPEDPGTHQGDFILYTTGTPISAPQEVHIPYQVPVHLVDTTIGK